MNPNTTTQESPATNSLWIPSRIQDLVPHGWKHHEFKLTGAVDLVTVLTTVDGLPANKVVDLTRGDDGAPQWTKESMANRAHYYGESVAVPDPWAMQQVLASLRPDQCLVLGVFPCAPPGARVNIVSQSTMQQLLGFVNGTGGQLGGLFVAPDGQWYLCRTAANMSPSTWRLVDFDARPAMPAEWREWSPEDLREVLAGAVPGFAEAGMVVLPSTGSRVVDRDGRVVLDSRGSFHAYVQTESGVFDGWQAALRVRTVNLGHHFTTKLARGHRIDPPFDQSAMQNTNRLAFDGAPALGQGAVAAGARVLPGAVRVIPGGRLLVNRIPELTAEESQQYTERTGAIVASYGDTWTSGSGGEGDGSRMATLGSRMDFSVFDGVSLDTVFETRDGAVTMRDFVESGSRKWRVQAIWRDSTTWNGFLGYHRNGLPFAADNGDRTKYLLDGPGKLEVLGIMDDMPAAPVVRQDPGIPGTSPGVPLQTPVVLPGPSPRVDGATVYTIDRYMRFSTAVMVSTQEVLARCALNQLGGPEGVMRVPEWGRWYTFEGKVWREDRVHHVFHEMRLMTHQLIKTMESPPPGATDEQLKLAGGRTGSLGTAAFLESTERLMRADKEIQRTTDQVDADPWVLNTEGGEVDLRTGAVGQMVNGTELLHDPGRFCTKMCRATPRRTPTPLWDKFLDETMRGDREMIGFLQRVVGSASIGKVLDHALFFFYGPGGNGKSVFVRVISEILGDYFREADPELMIETRGTSHPENLASLAGSRLVSISEVSPGKSWNEPLLNRLTGGDKVTARFMRQNSFIFELYATFIVQANNKPAFRQITCAIRRRLHLVPFLNKPAVMDPHLTDKLLEEKDGILQWMVDGCLAYQRDGLNPPAEVTGATNEYAESEDTLARWVEEECVIGDGQVVLASQLLASHKTFFEQEGTWAPERKTGQLIAKLDERFGGPLLAGIKRGLGRMRRHAVGIRLKTPEEKGVGDILPEFSPPPAP